MKNKPNSTPIRAVPLRLGNAPARPPFPKRARAVFYGLLAAWLATGVQAALPERVLSDPDGISGFELYDNGLFYWGGRGECDGEFPDTGHIRVRGTILGGTKRVARDCRINYGLLGNVVRDDQYVYYIDGSDGDIYRKALIAGEADPSGFLANGGGIDPGSLYLEIAEGYLYWSHYNTATGVSDFSRVKTDGSESGHYTPTIDAGAAVKKLKFVRYDDNGTDRSALIILFANGQLWRYKFNLARTRTLLETGVADFAVHKRTVVLMGSSESTYVYAAKGRYNATESAPPGSLVEINLESDAERTLFTASGNNQVVTVTTDSDQVIGVGGNGDRNIYIGEGPPRCELLGCNLAYVTLRRRLTTAAVDAPWIVFPGTGGLNLRSDDQWLYFGGIQRIRTDAPGIKFDIAATELEVVQFMQTLDGPPQSLVANKEGTVVRGYAWVVENFATGTLGPFFPGAELHAFLNGNEIPGSPFSPINERGTKIEIAGLPDFKTLRSTADRSFLFQLPPLSPGTLTLTMTVNPLPAIVETGNQPYANNSVSLHEPVPVVATATPCLVMVPLPTPFGTYHKSDASFPNIVRRAESLLPVEKLDIRGWAGLTEDHDLVNDSLFFISPFGGVNSNDDQDDDALDTIECLREGSSFPSGCLPLVHWVGMLPPALCGDPINFCGGLGKRPGRSLIAGMGNGGSGRTLAHELGHNYGRKHVLCWCPPSPPALAVIPKSPDSNYPQPWCSILPSGAGTYWGFDPISMQPVDPGLRGDLMSYSCDRWPSRYTWNAILLVLRIFAGLGPPPVLGGLTAGGQPIALLPSDPILFVSGRIDTNRNAVRFTSFLQLPASQFDKTNVLNSFAESTREEVMPNHLTFRLLDGTGAQLSEVALPLEETTDGPDAFSSFTHFIPFQPQTRRVQLVRGGVVFAERIVSPNAPALQLGVPVLDPTTQTLRVEWTASDPDGDPLIFWIHYSPDDGVTWNAYSLNYRSLSILLSTQSWPASPRGRLRVIASDGVNTTAAVSGPFEIPNHAPEVAIGGVAEGERLAFGDLRELYAMAVDNEDQRFGVRLNWNVIGPMALTGTNVILSLLGASPGTYTATLTATDRGGLQTVMARHFEVRSLVIPEGPQPVLDGMCADSGYANAAFVRLPLSNGRFTPARLVHSGSNLFVSFTELQFGFLANRSVGLRIDVNNNRSALGQAGDLGFFVDEDGIPFQEIGSGTGMATTLSPQSGFAAVIHRGSNGWCAELRIADHLLGGWNHTVGLMLDHGSPHWPVFADDNRPLTWAPAYLGTNPPPAGNRSPVAVTQTPLLVNLSAARTIALDGSDSFDADGDAIGYNWMQIAGPSITLSNATSANPQFTVSPPAAETVLRFRLTVSDSGATTSQSETDVILKPTRRYQRSSRPPALVSDGAFYGQFDREPGERYFIQASTNLTQWLSIHTNTVDFLGLLEFLEEDVAKYPMRFYRPVKE